MKRIIERNITDKEIAEAEEANRDLDQDRDRDRDDRSSHGITADMARMMGINLAREGRVFFPTTTRR